METLRLPPPLQVSRWLTIQVLLGEEEMASLLATLNQHHSWAIWLTSGVTTSGEESLDWRTFHRIYAQYLQTLQDSKVQSLTASPFRSFFSSAWTADPEAIEVLPLSKGRSLVRPIRPVVQLRPFSIGVDTTDFSLRPMTGGGGQISWGIEFAYPQLYEEPLSGEIIEVVDPIQWINRALYRTLQQWIRHHTIVPQFLTHLGKISAKKIPVRLGKKSLSWIENHLHLKRMGIEMKLPISYS